eukprot:859481-Pyramimonas_sp.AAC.2
MRFPSGSRIFTDGSMDQEDNVGAAMYDELTDKVELTGGSAGSANGAEGGRARGHTKCDTAHGNASQPANLLGQSDCDPTDQQEVDILPA